MLKQLSILGIAVGIVLSAHSSFATEPFSVYPFKIPERYQKALDNYRAQWTRVSGFEYSGLHWKQFMVVYINREAKIYANNYREKLRYIEELEELDEDEVTASRYKNYSPGTMLLKENFSVTNGSPGKPISITMMIKHDPGYDTKNGDWEYVQFDPKGNVTVAGKADDPAVYALCANCHVNIKERDYIFTSFYTQSEK